MSRGVLVKSVFDLPPSVCKVSNCYVGDEEVGLENIGKSIQELFSHKLYSYQLEAIRTVLKGNDCFLVVGTGSGKSEAFLFPILEDIVVGKINCAIIIYPTKQLAEDQEQRIAKYCNKIHELTGKRITYSRYNGDLTRKEIDYVEKSKPNIILATIDKLFYRFFKEGNEDFLDWLLNAGAFVVDEIHAGSGGYLDHVREMIAILKKTNPTLRVILASATVKEVETFRDKFLPSAQIITGNATRGSVRVMILQPESIEDLLLEKIDPYLRKVKGVCVIFVDDIRKVGELVVNCNELYKKKTNIPYEILRMHSPFACINSQLNSQEKTYVVKGVHNGTIRFVFTTSLLELGMDIPNIIHIISISWPITGINGLLQRLGRLRFVDLSEKKNFSLVLNPERTIDEYYFNHPEKIEEILMENKTERILFDSKSLQRAQAFVLLRLVLGVTKIKDILSLCTDELDNGITRTAISLLFAKGLLSTENHHIPYLERTLIIAERNEVNAFIRKHRIRSTEYQWEIILKNSKNQEEKIASIDERRIIFSALQRNLLHLGSKGNVFRVKSLTNEKVFVEKLNVNQINIERNKVKPPIFIIDGQSRTQQFEQLNIRFGRMIIRWETSEIMEYSRDGQLLENQMKGSTQGNDPLAVTDNEKLRNHIWDEKTSGVLIELVNISKALTNKQKKQSLRLFRELLVKSIELELHISESSFRTYLNHHENKIALYDRGGELGNAEAVFTQIKRVLKHMVSLLLENTNDSIIPLVCNISEKSIEITRKMLEEMVK